MPALALAPAIPLMVALMGLLIAAGLGGCLEEAADKDFKFDNPLDTTPSGGDDPDTSGVTIAHVNTNDDVVVIVNQSATDEELQNWTLENSDQTLIYTFPQFGLTIGKFVRVRTGDGTDDSNDLFTSSAIDLDWGNGISNQNARLKNDLGTLIDACDDVDDCWN